jgi:hypothetical protein
MDLASDLICCSQTVSITLSHVEPGFTHVQLTVGKSSCMIPFQVSQRAPESDKETLSDTLRIRANEPTAL